MGKTVGDAFKNAKKLIDNKKYKKELEKFQLICRDENTGKDIRIFNEREEGPLEMYEKINKNKLEISRFPLESNREKLFGRNILLHKLIKYLTSTK